MVLFLLPNQRPIHLLPASGIFDFQRKGELRGMSSTLSYFIRYFSSLLGLHVFYSINNHLLWTDVTPSPTQGILLHCLSFINSSSQSQFTLSLNCRRMNYEIH
jgi:hypothetical protein